MTRQRPDDEPRDAHLVAALRHAPDHDVTPPARVTAAILGHAQQAVRAPQSGALAWRDSLRSAFARLWQPAPMAAFGTLALATLIGVLWGGREWPDATPSLRPDQAAAPLRDDTAAGKAAPAPAADAVREATRTEPRPPALQPPLAGKPVAPAPATLPATARARQDATPPRRAAPQAEARVAAQGAAGAALQPAEAQPASRSSAGAEAAQAADAAAPAPVQRDALAKSLAEAAPAAARPRSEAAAPSATGSTRGIASPLTAIAAEIEAAASDPSRVRWRVAPQRLVAHDAAQRDWWSALVRESNGRWQRGGAGAGSGAESAPITLLIDGAPRGSVGFEPQAVIWRDASGAMWRAPIAADTSSAWREAVARW
jgi:hypothetical protein